MAGVLRDVRERDLLGGPPGPGAGLPAAVLRRHRLHAQGHVTRTAPEPACRLPARLTARPASPPACLRVLAPVFSQ